MAEFRPMRRFRQAATPEECGSVLRTASRGVLSVHGEGGYPYGIPMNFVYDDGAIFFHCAREGHKLDALRADPKACFTVLSEPARVEGEWWNRFTSVVVFGRVSEVRDPSRVGAALRSLGRKYFPEGYDMEDDILRNGPHAVVLELQVDHMSGKHVQEK